MSTATLALQDATTMWRRNLTQLVRYPSITVQLAMLPIVLLLLFVYVFGGTLGDGLAGTGGGRSAYVNYVMPGIVLMTITGVVQGTAIAVARDMTEGIMARFRTMAISRGSVLTGHVLGGVTQAVLSLALVVGVGVAMGFRPGAGVLDWLAVSGLLVALTFALAWVTVGCGLVSKTVEGASSLPMPLMFLPFLGTGFVPADSLPQGLRWFAEHQPFTPITESIRGLLAGAPAGDDTVLALAWCAVIALGGYLWSKRLFAREPVR